MTLINVACPLKQDEIRKKLESCETPKYTYVQRISPVEMQFDVTDTSGADPLHCTKNIIRSLPNGNVLFFRVLYDGQFFEGGPVYAPGTPEYEMMHKKRGLEKK